ncbi:hypothetical protein BH10BAC2_BH10BAC2_39750 [soil metagenome]
MGEITHTLPVVLDLPEQSLHLIVDVVATDNPNVFFIKKVSFQKDGNIIPFMNEFQLEKMKADNASEWVNKENRKLSMIGSAIGKAIEAQIILLK